MNLLTITPRLVWVDMPAALTEFLGLTDYRTKHDLSRLATVVHATAVTGTDNASFQVSKDEWNADHTIKVGSIRIVANVIVAGAAGSVLRVQYSTDDAAWNYLDHSAGPSVAISAAGRFASSYVTPNAAALADVFLRVVGLNGDAVVDPIFGQIEVQVK